MQNKLSVMRNVAGSVAKRLNQWWTLFGVKRNFWPLRNFWPIYCL